MALISSIPFLDNQLEYDDIKGIYSKAIDTVNERHIAEMMFQAESEMQDDCKDECDSKNLTSVFIQILTYLSLTVSTNFLQKADDQHEFSKKTQRKRKK